MPKYKILIAFAFAAGCSGAGGTSVTTRPDAPTAQPDALEPIQDTSPTQPDTQPASSTATSITTGTETKTDAGTTPDSLPQLTPDSSVPDAPAQVVKPDALPMAQDTLPQATPDAQVIQQPDAPPVAVDTKPATPDTLVLVDTKPATPDVFPAIDIKTVTPDTQSTTPDTMLSTDTVADCGGIGQPCCTSKRDLDHPELNIPWWNHWCTAPGYGCTIYQSYFQDGTVGDYGTCVPCGNSRPVCTITPCSTIDQPVCEDSSFQIGQAQLCTTGKNTYNSDLHARAGLTSTLAICAPYPVGT